MKKLLLLITLAAFTFSAHAVDLRDYFPASYQVQLNSANGAQNARYTFLASPAGYQGLYDTFFSLGKPGNTYLWKKEYYKNGAWSVATNAILFMGTDQSVTEVGDWYPSGGGYIVVGYHTPGGANTGLGWSPPAGLTATPYIIESQVIQQVTPGSTYVYRGQDAYSKTGLIEVLPTYAPPYGRDAAGNWCAGCSKTYTNVVHIVMYHGTKTASSPQIRCGTTSPVAAYGVYYQSFKAYNSYAIELYLAEGKGIIEEHTPFIEDGSYWGMGNCIGGIFSPGWVKYIDEQ